MQECALEVILITVFRAHFQRMTPTSRPDDHIPRSGIEWHRVCLCGD